MELSWSLCKHIIKRDPNFLLDTEASRDQTLRLLVEVVPPEQQEEPAAKKQKSRKPKTKKVQIANPVYLDPRFNCLVSLADDGTPVQNVPGAVFEVDENELIVSVLKKAIVSKLVELQKVPNVTNVPYRFKGGGRLFAYLGKQWHEVEFDGAFATYAAKKVCTDISYHFLFAS